MREIEVLIRCDQNILELQEKLKGSKFKSKSRVIDTYYYDEKRKNLQPGDNLRLNECFRIREKSDSAYMTYKVDKFTENDIWLYSDEFETKIEDAVMAKEIVNKLGLKQLIKIDNEKSVFENELYYIFVEDVVDLGVFVEVELKNDTDEDIELQKDRIREFINSLNLTNVVELNEGKPELMLKKMEKAS